MHHRSSMLTCIAIRTDKQLRPVSAFGGAAFETTVLRLAIGGSANPFKPEHVVYLPPCLGFDS